MLAKTQSISTMSTCVAALVWWKACLLASLLVAAGTEASVSPHPEQVETQQLFQAWSKQHDKTYGTAGEAAKRLSIWHDNDAYIANHNADHSRSFRLGHNQFSDLTLPEFQALFKLGRFANNKNRLNRQRKGVNNAHKTTIINENKDLPQSIDWRIALPAVKNQQMCGSCWAFSAVGAIEGKYFIDTGNVTALSEQELVDCDKNDFGCGGGLMDNAFLFDEYNATGLCSQEDYPYVGHKRWFRGCKSDKGLCEAVPHTQVANFTDVNNTEADLLQALAVQPVSVAIQANLRSFQFYKSGVYDDAECGNDLDHGVLAVGYGVDTNTTQPYFTIRNSWGAGWGDQGYIRMLRGKAVSNINGTCGLYGFASRPTLKDDDDDDDGDNHEDGTLDGIHSVIVKEK